MTRKRLPNKRPLTRIKAKLRGIRIYVDMGKHPDGSLGEVFVTVAKVGSLLKGILDSWARMVSVSLQYGTPLWKIIAMEKDFEFEPNGDVDAEGVSSCRSIVDLVMQVLENEFPEQAKKSEDEDKEEKNKELLDEITKLRQDSVDIQSKYLETTQELERYKTIIGKLSDWTHQFGAELCPPARCADSYGEGVHEMKATVARIISGELIPEEYDLLLEARELAILFFRYLREQNAPGWENDELMTAEYEPVIDKMRKSIL